MCLLNYGPISPFDPLLYSFFAYLILSQITRQSPLIGPLSPHVSPPPCQNLYGVTDD